MYYCSVIMFYKGIIFDLDNTIYSYDSSHSFSINAVFNYLSSLYGSDYNLLVDKYKEITVNLKNELINTASSHNKCIYFKHLLEFLKIDISVLEKITAIYWETFYESMVLYEGVLEFILWNKKHNIKMGILTDYETEYQVTKLEKVGLLEYFDIVITSEEVGIEKPSVQMFQRILMKLGLYTYDVLMIGDNYIKDIKGAMNLGIYSYWFQENSENSCYDEYSIFNSYNYLTKSFEQIYSELKMFSDLSRYCGERFDLVQAGGGNSSVKINEWLIIKASGYSMANININSGYVVINNLKLKNDILLNKVKEITEYNIFGNLRASIETFMHATLKKYVLHLHPIQLNRVLVSKNAREIINILFPCSLILDYFTPGIKLCNELKSKYTIENIVFLLNHGIIICSDVVEEIYDLLNMVLVLFEKYENVNYDSYKFTNILSRHILDIFNVETVSYLSEDLVINSFLHKNSNSLKIRHTFPDSLIYCGIEVCFMYSMNDLVEYKIKYGESPKIIVVNNKYIYINANTIQKCREIEDVFKSSLLILDTKYNKELLKPDEICYLNNWDAEKYRKML